MSLKKCKECGNKVSSSATTCPQCGYILKTKPGCLTYITIAIALYVILSLINRLGPSSVPTPAQISEPKDISNQINSQQVAPEAKPEGSAGRGGIIQVDPDVLINAYRNDEKSADVQYRDRRVAVTGVISGIVKTPDEVIMKAYQEGMDPEAFFIAIGGEPPFSVSQYSGITAFFGQKDAAIASHLTRGQTVTVVCRCTGKLINAIDLRECELHTQSPNIPSVASTHDYNDDFSKNLIGSPGYKTYTNERFGFKVDYPQSFVVHQPSQNGDGVKITSADGKIEIAATGGNNSGFTMNYFYDTCIKSIKIDPEYKRKGKNWFVISWNENGKITHIKMFVGIGSHNTLTISYPEIEKTEYDRVLSRIEKSFKRGKIEHTW